MKFIFHGDDGTVPPVELFLRRVYIGLWCVHGDASTMVYLCLIEDATEFTMGRRFVFEKDLCDKAEQRI
jgi:hypothetical protein